MSTYASIYSTIKNIQKNNNESETDNETINENKLIDADKSNNIKKSKKIIKFNKTKCSSKGIYILLTILILFILLPKMI